MLEVPSSNATTKFVQLHYFLSQNILCPSVQKLRGTCTLRSPLNSFAGRRHQRSMLPVLWKTSWATKRSSKCLCLRYRRKFGRGKSVFDYRFYSNKHTHMFLFVTQAFWVFIVRIWFFWCGIWVYLKSLNGSPLNAVLFGSILLIHSKTINAKVVSMLHLYTKRSIQKALQFWPVVNKQKTWKVSEGVFCYSSAKPWAFAQWLIRPCPPPTRWQGSACAVCGRVCASGFGIRSHTHHIKKGTELRHRRSDGQIRVFEILVKGIPTIFQISSASFHCVWVCLLLRVCVFKYEFDREQVSHLRDKFKPSPLPSICYLFFGTKMSRSWQEVKNTISPTSRKMHTDFC